MVAGIDDNYEHNDGEDDDDNTTGKDGMLWYLQQYIYILRVHV